MTAALTPELAVRYLAELEPALEAVAVLASDATTLAGDSSPASSVGERVLTARGAGHAVIALVGAGVFEALVRHDLEAVARELG